MRPLHLRPARKGVQVSFFNMSAIAQGPNAATKATMSVRITWAASKTAAQDDVTTIRTLVARSSPNHSTTLCRSDDHGRLCT